MTRRRRSGQRCFRCRCEALIRLFPSFDNLAVERDPILFPFIVQHEPLCYFATDDDNVG